MSEFANYCLGLGIMRIMWCCSKVNTTLMAGMVF